MAILYYLKGRISRAIASGLVVCLVLTALCWFACMYDGLIEDKLDELDEAYETIPVTIVISNITGTRTDNLGIFEHLLKYFIRDEYVYLDEVQPIPFSAYVKDVRLKSTVYFRVLPDPMPQELTAASLSKEARLVGATTVDAVRELDPVTGVRITYFEGYDASMFATEDTVCIVSKDYFDTLEPNADGEYWLNLGVQTVPEGTEVADLRLKIAGVYSGSGEAIYCPWQPVADMQLELDNTYRGDSLSATVSDNRELETFREMVSRHFVEVNLEGRREINENDVVLMYYEHAATLHDETLRQVVTEINQSRQTLTRLFPLVVGMEMLIGFFACFLYIQGRKRELAVARSLGTRRGQVLLSVGLEMLIWIPVSALLSVVIYKLSATYTPPYAVIAGILASALGGALAAGYVYSGRNKIRSIKEED